MNRIKAALCVCADRHRYLCMINATMPETQARASAMRRAGLDIYARPPESAVLVLMETIAVSLP